MSAGAGISGSVFWPSWGRSVEVRDICLKYCSLYIECSTNTLSLYIWSDLIQESLLQTVRKSIKNISIPRLHQHQHLVRPIIHQTITRALLWKQWKPWVWLPPASMSRWNIYCNNNDSVAMLHKLTNIWPVLNFWKLSI